MGTKGLESVPESAIVGAPEEKPQGPEGRKRAMTSVNPANEVVNGDMRLAWMFVQGWRQRLRRGEKLLEEHREEGPPAGSSSWHDPDDLRRSRSARKPKSVNWEL